MGWKLHELHKYAIKNMYTLPVYALNFEILKFQQLLNHILRVFSCLRGKFNICGLDHFASEPFNY